MFPKEEIGYLVKERQKKRLEERRKTKLIKVNIEDLDFEIYKGVYQTAKDTELMAEVVKINNSETFLEIGCGCGAISIILSKRAKDGLGVDINPLAIDNSKINANIHNISNVSFILGDLFKSVEGEYNVILFNPPYSSFSAKDEIDRMFWDLENLSKINFFKQVKKFLKPKGRVYFGWADFDDLNKDLPMKLAKENNLVLKETYKHKVENRPYTYIVYEFT